MKNSNKKTIGQVEFELNEKIHELRENHNRAGYKIHALETLMKGTLITMIVLLAYIGITAAGHV